MANTAQPENFTNNNYKNYVLTGDTKRTDAVGNIYIHKNDPKVVNRGIHLTNVRQAQGGYYPVLTDLSYNERKNENSSYSYNAKIDHGTRPMHKTTFSLGNIQEPTNYTTKHKIDYQGFKLRPEYLPSSHKNQFDHHFDIGINNQFDSNTHYGSEFYFKNDNKDYVSTFDTMPKYSVGKQLNQLIKDNKVKEYNNRKSNIKEVLTMENDNNFWTQYKRTHDYLGHLRGNGVPKIYPEKESYNVLTGEKSPNFQNFSNNKRISGDFILSKSRQCQNKQIIG